MTNHIFALMETLEIKNPEYWLTQDPEKLAFVGKFIADQAKLAQSIQQQLSEANKVIEGKWISVEDELPERFENVLWYQPEVKRTNQTLKARVVLDYVQPPRLATHWMPLPPAPKEIGSPIYCAQCTSMFNQEEAVRDANGEAFCSEDCAHESDFDSIQEQP